jgi:hypothetical protein
MAPDHIIPNARMQIVAGWAVLIARIDSVELDLAPIVIVIDGT